MSDLTGALDELLQRDGASTSKRDFSLEDIDEFLKEAYRINSHITALHTELKDVRQAYLSTAQPRKAALSHLRSSRAQQSSAEAKHLTDRQREDIDANAKQMLRELNASIRALADAEQLRRETETTVLRRKYGRGGLGALGAWAAGGGGAGGGGGGGGGKSTEWAAAEERAAQLGAHREGVLLYLRQRLQECGQTQQGMMEARLTREMEKNRSVLARAGPGMMAASMGSFGGSPELGGPFPGGAAVPGSGVQGSSGVAAADEEEQGREREPADDDLTEAQRQMFEKGNQDMLRHYESTLDKVRTAEKSLVEISELQTLLVNNLAMQSAHIDQLVADSFNTTENVSGGNKQLKKATQRASPARYTFFAASGLCLFLVVWDLVI